MSWKGVLAGSVIGSAFGGPLGALFGAALGHQIEKRIRSGGARRRVVVPRDELAAEYRLLGASAADSPETLKRKYRELAKRNHPDVLRAQGMSEAMIGSATERMGRINSAWAKIKSARGL